MENHLRNHLQIETEQLFNLHKHNDSEVAARNSLMQSLKMIQPLRADSL